MNIIFQQTGMTMGTTPQLTLIENNPELIVGCIFLVGDRQKLSTIPADPRDIAEQVNQGTLEVSRIDTCLIVREPNTMLQITGLATLEAINFNVSGAGGAAGQALINALGKHNIPVWFSSKTTDVPSHQQDQLWKERSKQFLKEFGELAHEWLPRTWSYAPIHY
ncbi:MAG: hypothetical protein F6K65_35575 [Moorea sp. SIO3C2]|nr:hypothetical protein [Moorena sp. SIO3C2]